MGLVWLLFVLGLYDRPLRALRTVLAPLLEWLGEWKL